MKIFNFKFHILNSKRGFIISIITFFVLAIMISVAITMSALVFYRQQISTNAVKSTQSYYAAEAGIEDALLRLNKNPTIAVTSYDLSVGESVANVTILDAVSNSKNIESQGNTQELIRKVKATYVFEGEGNSFFYGIQVGEGGLIMNNNSKIIGNVFSNGHVTGGNGSAITGTVQISGSGNKLSNVDIGVDAYVDICENNGTNITGVLHANNANNCNYGSLTASELPVNPVPLPIADSQIDAWRVEAANSQIINNNFVIDNSTTQSLGPAQIMGSLTVKKNSTLNVTGTISVFGPIIFENGSTVKLDNFYGYYSGVIISSNTINVKNGSLLEGSGQEGSYLLVVSTMPYNSSSINVDNNAFGAIFYTNNGGITLSNNTGVKAIIGYQITLNNNAEVTYESGLSNVLFYSGPGGGWKVENWEEK